MIDVDALSGNRLRAPRWLWPEYLGRGKLVMLDGDPEVGKSLFALDLAARLSRGLPFPGSEVASSPASSIFYCAEDDLEDTLLPRAEAAGADLDRILFATDVSSDLPQLPDDIPRIEELIHRQAARLVVIDPLIAFLPPRISITSDQCIRRALTPLAALAARTGAVVMLIRHLTKMLGLRALYRGSGSIGVIGAARTGLIVGRHPLDPNLRVLAVTKSNLVRSPLSLSYRINSDTQGRAVIEWLGPVEFQADDLCARMPGPLRPRERAIGWLVRELEGGPRKASDLYAAAIAAKIPEKTLLRAKQDLSVESHQVHDKTGRREWFWYDPAAVWPANAPFPRPLSLMEQFDQLPKLGPLEM